MSRVGAHNERQVGAAHVPRPAAGVGSPERLEGEVVEHARVEDDLPDAGQCRQAQDVLGQQ